MWFDLAVADAGQAREFYRALFGWAVAPAADAGPYQAWITGGEQPWAGIVRADTEGGGWLPYVIVEDLDEAAKHAVSLGATVIAGAADGPAGTSVTIADPGGAKIALFQPRVSQG